MWRNPQFPADLVTLTEEILNGKLIFLGSETMQYCLQIFTESNMLCWIYYISMLFFKSMSELLLLAHIEKLFFVKVFVDEKSPIVIKTNCLWIEVINVEGRSLMKAICSKLSENCTIPDKTPA